MATDSKAVKKILTIIIWPLRKSRAIPGDNSVAIEEGSSEREIE
jgi:hypothetical protein